MFRWSDYNENLVKWGEMLLNLDFLARMEKELKEMNRRKRGRAYRVYPLFILNFSTPENSIIQRRREGKFESVEINGNVLIVDSTGFKMSHATEYVEYRHKLKRREKCYKFHIIRE